MLKGQNGVTLIALIVTIIVLIILAAVSIQLTIGDNGIINHAKEAAKVQANAEARDIELLNTAVQYIDNAIYDLDRPSTPTTNTTETP